MEIKRVVLAGRRVRLEPLTLADVPALAEIGLDPSLWRWTASAVRSPDEMRAYVEQALRLEREGTALPFLTVDAQTGHAAGSTRFAAIDRANRRVEIGWTWLASEYQRTALNSEAKLLMLAHAFETWGCIRVELKTDALNERSRAAIRRIGAREEGILRKHMVTSTGRVRDTVYHSVLDDEWPAVKRALLDRIAAAEGGPG
jgi:RimJ/RimL family protein N-acetyltransferase